MRIVILCGGSGSRLWPESRESLPKQYIPIFESKSLLDLTIERVLKLLRKNKPIFVCNKKHAFLVKNSLEKYNLEGDILLEPKGKNTCPAIYLAAKQCEKKENILIMPSDHLITDTKSFIKNIIEIEKILKEDQWITLGINPVNPSDAYGYISVSKKTKNKLIKVDGFIEKPQKKIAQKLINNGNVYWNAGIFIAKKSTILNSIKKHAPKISESCENVFNKITSNKNEFNYCPDLFSQIPAQSIDYAIMEHEKNIYLYPFNNQWSDVGSWDSVSEIFKTENNNKNIIQIDSNNNFIRSKERIIATIGVEDLIVVDNDNATLISKKNQSEKVKMVVNTLLERSLIQAKEHTFENRPWGKFENLYVDEKCKVKKITVYPKKRLSLQYHNFRSEHWLVVNGKASVHIDGKDFSLLPGQSIDIPLKSKHFIKNETDKNLTIIETQLGTYFGEDDIIRLDDPYDR